MFVIDACPGKAACGGLADVVERPVGQGGSAWRLPVVAPPHAIYWLLVIRYSLFVIRYSLFVIRYSLFVIRYSLFVTRYSLLVIRYSLFVTRYSLLVIRGGIRCPALAAPGVKDLKDAKDVDDPPRVLLFSSLFLAQ